MKIEKVTRVRLVSADGQPVSERQAGERERERGIEGEGERESDHYCDN